MKKFGSFESGEKKRETGDLDEEKMLDALRGHTGRNISKKEMHCVEGTYEVDTDSFTLTFTIDESFEIRSIDVRGNSGLGGEDYKRDT